MDRERLTEFLRRRMPDAEDLQVVGLKRISGGSSRETYSFDLEWRERGETLRRPLIGRRDPTGGLLKSERQREFRVIEAMHRAGLHVPEAVLLEPDPSVMERPFFIMHRATGRTSSGAFPTTEPAALGEKIAGQFLDELAHLQSLDYKALGLTFLGEP